MRKLLLALAMALVALIADVQVVSAQSSNALSEDFNGISSGIPSGWDNSEGTTNTASYRWNYHSEGRTGGCLRFNSYNNYPSGNDNVLKTPQMNLSSGAWRLRFWYKNPNGGNFKVYLSNDGGTTRTLIADALTGQSNWTEKVIPITSAINGSSTVYIYFHATSNYGSGDAYIYLDDVTVEPIPDCRTPEGLSISALTTTSATLSWSLSTDGVSNPSLYHYTLKTANGTIVDSSSTLSAPNLDKNITGLTANTTYTVELTGDCNAADYGLSNVASVTFTTLCNAQSAPYTSDFNDLIGLPGCTFSHNAELATGGRSGNAIALTTTTTDGAYIVFPELTLSSNNAEATIWVKTNGTYGGNTPIQIGIVTDPSDVAGSFEPLYNSTLASTSWTEIRMNTSLTALPTTTTTKIAVQIGSGFDRTTLIDDISIHAIPTCVRPENFAISNITSSSVDLSWTTTNATQARIKVISGTDTTYRLATTNPYTVTGLTPNTEYSFTVRGICSATDSSEVNPTTLSAKTACVVAQSPLFSQNFDNLGGATVPDCWNEGWINKPTDNTKTVPFTLSGSYAHSGTYAMSLVDQPSGSLSYLSTQCLPIDSAGKYTLSVWVYRQDDSYYPNEGLKFWVAPHFNDTTGATLLGYVPRHYASAPAEPTASEWYNYEYVINNTGNQYILVEGISEYGAATLFDDMEVKITPSCVKVKNIAVGTPSATDVAISWTAGKNESQWIVDYTLSQSATPVSIVTDTVNTPSLTISGLTAASTYDVTGWVKAYCGGNDASDSVRFSFTFVTACNAIANLPYTCGFESTEISTVSHPLPFCWNRYNDAPQQSNAYYPYAYSSSSYPRTGTHCLQFYPITSSWTDYGANQVAILPELDVTAHAMNSLRAVFYARLSSAYNTGVMVYVGAITDPADITSFVAVDSFLVTATSYVKCEADFSGYQGNATRMAIRVPRSGGSYSLYIDDVKIDLIPNCIDIVGDPTITDITATSAVLSMTDNTATAWSYAYGVSGTPVSSCTIVDTAGVNVVNLTGLQPQTTYDVYVRRNCLTEYGSWSDVVSFKTACAAENIPFYDDFEDYSVDSLKGCYSVSNPGYYYLKVHSSSASATGTSQVNHTTGGSQGVCSSSSYTTPYQGSGDYSALAYVHLETGKNYEISVYAKAGNGWDGIAPWSLSFRIGSTLNNVHQISSKTVSATSWNRYNTYFTVDATGDYFIGLSASATDYYYVFFDDLAIDEVSCIPPTATTVTNLTSSSATVGLTSSSSSWVVAVSSTPIDIEGIVTGDIMYDTINTPSFTVNGLSVNTEYYYTISSICSGGGMSAWMEPASFRTTCSTFNLPYVENFTDLGSTLCWTTVGGTGTISRSTSGNNAGGSMSVAGAMASSPELNTTNLVPYTLTGWALTATDSVQFEISVGNSPTDVSEFMNLSTVTLSPANTWIEFTCNFNAMLGNPDYQDFQNAKYIALTTNSGTTVLFDDLMVDITPTCPKPNGGTVTNVTAHTATIGWTESGTATNWVLEAVPASGASVSTGTATNPVTLTGLNAATSYTAYVRSICTIGSDTSNRYKIGVFTTECDYVTAPYNETFEGFADGGTPNCWDNTGSTTATLSTSPGYVWGIHSTDGNKAIRMYNYGVRSGSALINTPEIILDATKSYELRYDYCNQSSSGDMKVKIKRHGEAQFTQIASCANNGSQDEGEPSAYLTGTYGLNAYAGDTIQIQFYNDADWGYGSMWVDNVKVRELSNCLDPAAVTTSNITESSATVTITDTVAAHTSWQYAYGVAGFDVSTATPTTTANKVFNLTGLTSSTQYDVYVRAVCNATESSPWVQATFKTTSQPATLPYVTDFSDNTMNAAWDVFGTGSNQFTFGRDANALFATGNAAAYISNGGQYTYSTSSTSKVAIGRMFSFAAASYDIEFDWKCSGGESSYDYARFYLCPANVNPLPNGSGSYSSMTWPSGIIALDGDTYKNYTTADQHVSQVVDFTGIAGSYYLVFVWVNDGSSGTSEYPLSVSNVQVSELNCQLITAPRVITSLTTLTSITATCTNPNPGAATRYAVSTSTSITDSIVSGIAASDTFTINGLSASTNYYLLLRAECSANDASPWISTPFTTSCGVITQFPFVQDFEAVTTIPACWANASTAIGYDWWDNPVPGEWLIDEFSYTHYGNGNAWARLNGYTGSAAILATPAFNVEADREYHISFAMYHYGSSYYTDEVNVYVGPNQNLTGATKLASLTAYDQDLASYTDAVTLHDYDLPTGLNGNFYLIFEGKYEANGMVYIDDITIDRYPLCRNLTANPTIVATTATTATVSEPLGNHSAIEFGIAPYSAGVTPLSITSTVTSTTGTATFTGLTASTNYAVFARGICSEVADTTVWSNPTQGQTKADDCFTPDGIHTVGNISDTSATIAWNPVPDAQMYQYTFNGTTSTTTATQVTFNNLTASTSYQFTIRAVCGVGDTTAYSQAFQFKTIQTPAQIPYFTGFEATDDNSMWMRTTSAETNNLVFGTSTGGRCTGNQGLYISDNGSSYSQTVPTPAGYYYNDIFNITYASRTIYFPAAGNYDISFDWKCDPVEGNSMYNYYEAFGRAFLTPVDVILIADDSRYHRTAPENSVVLGNDLTGSRIWQTSSNVVSVTEPCYRNVVFMWYAQNQSGYATTSNGSAYPLALDNLSITEINCLPANTVTVAGVSDTYATAYIDKSEPVDINYAVLTVNSKDSIQSFTTVASTALSDTINLTGLTASTQYYLFVRTVCDSTHVSNWRSASFRTTGTPAVLPYVCDFETASENNNWTYSLTGTNHFMIGTSTSNGGQKSIYVTSDNISNSYDNNTQTNTYAYRIFYLPEGLYEYSYDWKGVGESTFDYARIFLLPADVTITEGSQLAGIGASSLPSRSIALDGGSYLNQSNDFQTVNDTFSITEAASYNMVLYWKNDGSTGSNPPLAVDNVSLKSATCLPPSATVTESQLNSVTAVFQNNSDSSLLVYAVSATGNFVDAIVVDTLPYSAGPDTVVINGLNSSTSYKLLVRSICGAGDESFWSRTSFKTLCGTVTSFPYLESFESIGTTYIQGLADDICWEALNDNSNFPTYHGSTTNPYDGEQCLQMHSSGTTDLYMILPEMNDINNLNLSFQMKSENTSTSTGIIYAGYMTNPNLASSFVSLLATARSTSWRAQNVVITGAPAGARIAFKYGNAGSSNYYGYLDNIRVSQLAMGPTYYDTVCYNKPYNLHGFSQAASTMQVGDNTFTLVINAQNEGESDTIYTAHVYMRANSASTTYDTICAGQPYTKGLWSIGNPTTRRYYRTFTGSSSCGCDTTVELYLTVMPTSYTIMDTICNGGSYQFGDTIITDPGMYVRNYVSAFGCASTDTLYLMVMPDSVFDVAEICEANLPYVWRGTNIYTGGRHTKQIVGEHGCNQTAVLDLTVFESDSTVFVAFCQGGSAQVADTIIKDDGTYTLVRINQHGCNVTYHITATVTAPSPENVYDNACENHLYTGYGISNLYVDADTIVVVNTKTIDAKCDSVAIVHLTFVKTVYSDTTAWIKQGESLTWHDNTYSKAGDYPVTLQSSIGCDSVVTLHLNVSGTGVENVSDVNMNIVPNPVNAGQTSFVYGNFTGVKNVEILNSFGQVIEEFIPESYPIEVNGITASGIYYVRIITDTDKVLVEKLIVK